MVGAVRFSEGVRRDAVELVASTGRSINSVAKYLRGNTESLRKWVRAAESSQADRRRPSRHRERRTSFFCLRLLPHRPQP
ncbi:transposase [Streptomyces sp. NBC_01304]|uniref:transposase n=1 Tax=Streptomyces sp. NBC_01304 TaxID=2903818 RepID=UPI003FA38697